MRDTSRNPKRCTWSSSVLDPINVQQKLALEYIAPLIVIWMYMQRRRLATTCGVLEQNEGVSRLHARHLEVNEAAREPEVVACFLLRDHRHCAVHTCPPVLMENNRGTFIPLWSPEFHVII